MSQMERPCSHWVKSVLIRSFFWSVFSHVRTDTSYLSVFSPNSGNNRPEKTPYLDTFHAVSNFHISFHWFLSIFPKNIFWFSDIFREYRIERPVAWNGLRADLCQNCQQLLYTICSEKFQETNCGAVLFCASFRL